MKKQIITAAVTLSLIFGGSLATVSSSTAYAATTTQTGTIVKGSPYFHKTPVSGGATMGFVKKSSVVKVIEVTNKWWVKIQYQGVTGWVSSSYISVAATTTHTPTPIPIPTPAPTPTAVKPIQPWEQSADKLIAYAQGLIGKVQYQYGGRDLTNPAKLLLDCSSYTQYVYKQALGLKMGWGANTQFNAFPQVEKANLRKGDLVFFSVSTPGKIGHVGIYIGEGKFIHNVNKTSNVVISNLNSGYYSNHYINAARVIK